MLLETRMHLHEEHDERCITQAISRQTLSQLRPREPRPRRRALLGMSRVVRGGELAAPSRMPVVVDGYDSLCANSIAVIAVVPDAVKADLIGVVGDHQRPEQLGEAGSDTGWGGELARPYHRDARATAPVTALVLTRSDKQHHHR